jgi:hypothetical protein
VIACSLLAVVVASDIVVLFLAGAVFDWLWLFLFVVLSLLYLLFLLVFLLA